MINGRSLQWYDYGARFYDPQIGRWHSADPLAENRLWVSPFQYVQNNPITRIDTNGMLDGCGWVSDDHHTFWDPNTNSQEEFETNYTNLGKNGYSYEGQTTELTDDEGHQFFGDDTGNISTLLDEVSLYGERPQNDSSGQEGGLGIVSTVFGGIGVAGDITSMSNSTFRLTNGAYNGSQLSPNLYSGWKGGSVARITTYSLSEVGSALSFGASLVTTGNAYYDITTGQQ